MGRTATPALMLVAVLVLAGCNSGSQESDQSAAGGSGGDETAATTEADSGPDTATTSPEDTDTDDDADDDAKGDADGTDDSETEDLVLTVRGEKTTIEPTAVYCSGAPGNIRHIIGKTNNGLPLVKAEGTRFAMVKTGQQRPYKAESPDGIEYHKDRVTFNDTELGSATLNGSMACTDWED